MSCVLSCVVVAMSDERSFPMIMEISVRDGHPFASMGYVDEAIIIIFVMSEIRIEFAEKVRG